jgi:hypothetical protein
VEPLVVVVVAQTATTLTLALVLEAALAQAAAVALLMVAQEVMLEAVKVLAEAAEAEVLAEQALLA